MEICQVFYSVIFSPWGRVLGRERSVGRAGGTAELREGAGAGAGAAAGRLCSRAGRGLRRFHINPEFKMCLLLDQGRG